MRKLERDILLSLQHFYEEKPDPRHLNWTKMHGLIQKHEKLYRNRDYRYPYELFRDGCNEAWAALTPEKIKKILRTLEAQGIEFCLKNGDRIVSSVIFYLNRMIKNQTISILRKESIPLDENPENSEEPNDE